MPFKQIAQADSITNVRIGAKVAKRHNEDPKVLIQVSFTVPAGDIAKIGPLLELERTQQNVRALFYVEESQRTLDAGVADALTGTEPCPACHGTGEIHDKDGNEILCVFPCTVCEHTGRVKKGFSITGEAGGEPAADADKPATNQEEATEKGDPIGDAARKAIAAEATETSDKAFDNLEHAGHEPAEPPAETKPRRRGRQSKKDIEAAAALANTRKLEPGDVGSNGDGNGYGLTEGAAAGAQEVT